MMTMDLFNTYKRSDPEIKTMLYSIPKRYITSPNERKFQTKKLKTL